MSKLKKYSLLLLCALWAGGASAQYYSWGGDPATVRWSRIETPDVKLIYPTDFDEGARRMLWYLDTVRSHLGFGFRHGTMRTPVVVHNRNMTGNGMVMWAPKRIELLAAPGSSYSEPWLKQLAIHEYRHNVQYNNLYRGVDRVLGWFLGEQIAFLGVGQFSIFVLEGDATMAETEMSAFGRGLQPSWTMHYRAMNGAGEDLEVGSRRYAKDYWFSGSFRNYIPNHYQLGYQMVRWSYDRFDQFIWSDMARYVARNPQVIIPMSRGLKKKYGLSQSELMRRTFSDLNDWWDSLPRVEDSSVRIPTPETSYTTYRWPLWLDDGTLVAFKGDLDRYNRVVKVNTRTGEERLLAYTGPVSSRPVLSPDGKLWWTEYRSSMLWDQKTDSQLYSLDLETGRKRTHPSPRQIFYPVVKPDGTLVRVEYDYSGRFSITDGTDSVAFPPGIEITGLALDDTTEKLYFIGLDDGGMFLGAICGDSENFERITPSRHITLSDLRAEGGKLWFGSIVSGKDEAHCFDPATGIEYRLTGSAYGSFQPSLSPDGTRTALTTYDRHGYHLALQNIENATEQEQRNLPVNLVNPPWKRWDLPPMDSLVYTPDKAERSKTVHKARRYRKGLHLFRPHSYLPLDFYPPAALQEMDLHIGLGATVMSQNLLSDAVSWLSYGWSRGGGSMLRGGFSYSGLGPVLDVDFTYGGGPQILYSLLPETITLELKPYFGASFRASLPMILSSGYWFGSLSPSAEYFYTNGLIFREGSDGRNGALTRGVDRLSFAVSYSGQTRMAQKEFLPRWGIGLRAGYVVNPTNRDFKSTLSASLRSWLPGIVRPHSTSLKLAWQQSIGPRDAIYGFRLKEVFPRGAVFGFSTSRMMSGSLDYQFPVWYPEGGWTGFVYFKRIRLNLFADYARWKDFGDNGRNGPWHPLYSYGGDVILDVNPLRMPANSGVTVRLTVAKPSDRRGVFVGFGFGLPI